MNLTLAELEEHCLKFGEPKYRARQILNWVYHHRIGSFQEMTNLPKEVRKKLAASFYITSSQIKQITTSRDGTKKILIELADKNYIESVLLFEQKRVTLCLSTQVGCPVKCSFCASGLNGLVRQLATHEILEQVYFGQKLIEKRISNLVFMGMGEPFLNYQNLVKALVLITSPWGFGIGTHRITVSTVGILEKIERFSREKIATNLAISLHAPNDYIREQLIPLAKKVKVNTLIKAAEKYHQITRKDITFEYLLIDGVNTSERDAYQLVDLLKTTSAKVNLITYNSVKGLPYQVPSETSIKRFQNILRDHGLIAMLRKSKGQDIQAACGQLALQVKPG